MIHQCLECSQPPRKVLPHYEVLQLSRTAQNRLLASDGYPQHAMYGTPCPLNTYISS
ncbi:hypothetical protein M404DRAFT_992708 [Pisolithus tinctorius Marx 270]|uniref:Uncharacterized protein n=1 Tax=Pisolithus tinctorius Marx 270 TaxID=870435 RepID=A0A0C3PW62_PISTI|nr:hypothetical protein M404DRAFT_992708 [Pisolithus tinctorius Marx 270]